MIYYLAQPYSKDPEKSFTRAIVYTNAIISTGKFVFSPVLHTHNYHKWLVDEGINNPVDLYYKWDLVIMAEFKEVTLVLCPGWTESKGCLAERDFAALHDIPIIEYRELIGQ